MPKERPPKGAHKCEGVKSSSHSEALDVISREKLPSPPHPCAHRLRKTKQSELVSHVYWKSDITATASESSSGCFEVHPHRGLCDLQVGQAAKVLEKRPGSVTALPALTLLREEANPSQQHQANKSLPASTAQATHQKLQHFLGVWVHFDDLLIEGRDLGTEARQWLGSAAWPSKEAPGAKSTLPPRRPHPARPSSILLVSPADQHGEQLQCPHRYEPGGPQPKHCGTISVPLSRTQTLASVCLLPQKATLHRYLAMKQ